MNYYLIQFKIEEGMINPILFRLVQSESYENACEIIREWNETAYAFENLTI